ncbi:MAG: phosphocholine cytidylyltransferase family protein [Candidatus Methanoplasma sp.]|jgi:choline kinase|nr:phosphocholine cytidylyltransferase family protein [Candidatus Methanoplasma sp.]
MKAILMAAGVGSRISRTINRPKSTLAIGGTTIIRHTVEMLEANGIDVHVVTGFMYEDVHAALEGCNVTFHHNPFFKDTNSIASLWFARDVMDTDEDMLLMNADVFWEQNILDILLSDEHDVTMLGDISRAKDGDYFFRTENDLIVEYGKELPPGRRSCEYVGIAKIGSSAVPDFRDHLVELVMQGRYGLWWENALYEYKDKTPIFVRTIDGNFWAEVDYIEDYNRILAYLDRKKD